MDGMVSIGSYRDLTAHIVYDIRAVSHNSLNVCNIYLACHDTHFT